LPFSHEIGRRARVIKLSKLHAYCKKGKIGNLREFKNSEEIILEIYLWLHVLCFCVGGYHVKGLIILPILILFAAYLAYRELNEKPKKNLEVGTGFMSLDKSIYKEEHEFVLVNPSEFKDRDIKFYDKEQKKFSEIGCKFIGDVEDLALLNKTPKIRTFIRVMASKDGDFSLGIYDATPKGYYLLISFIFGMLPLKHIDIESEFEDGHFIITTTSPKTPISQPESISTLYVSRKLPVQKMIAIHMNEVSTYLKKTNSRLIKFYSLNDVIGSQKRQVKLKKDYRDNIGYDLTKTEREEFEKGLLTVIAKINKWAMAQELRHVNTIYVNPDRFGDPIAQIADWKPVKYGRNKFSSYKLLKVNSKRVEIKTTTESIISSLAFTLTGIGFMVYFISIVNRFKMTTGIIIALLVALIMTSISGSSVHSKMFPVVFDKQMGYVWKRRRPQGRLMNKEANKNYVRLELIHALQIIPEYHRMAESDDYYSYDLNLVLKNGDRIYIVGHYERQELVANARFLAEFLEVPIWNAATDLDFICNDI
jgi:hypothetical protein